MIPRPSPLNCEITANKPRSAPILRRYKTNDSTVEKLGELLRENPVGLLILSSIQAALDWLEGENWICSEPTGGTGPGSGRRTLRYLINPAVKTKTQG